MKPSYLLLKWFPPRSEKNGRIVLFFDGECGLCDRLVTILIDLDQGKVLTFSPLQGEAARRFIRPDTDTLIVVDQYGTGSEEVLYRSAAVFRALGAVGGIGRVLASLRVLPLWVCDKAYSLIARNRHRIFGRQDSCKMMSPELRERFLD